MSLETFEITPLGAAYVEALPDHKLARKVQRDFKQRRVCPTSCLFPTKRLVEDFYGKKRIRAVEPEAKP